jgi:hypothetical protein
MLNASAPSSFGIQSSWKPARRFEDRIILVNVFGFFVGFWSF